ncbi:MAG: alpha-hydroxy acid oxidase [Actinomycetota bacterium]
MNVDEVLRLDEFEALAREKLEPEAYAYYVSAAADGVTAEENVAAFSRRKLRPRVLIDVSDIDTSVELLGVRVAVPFGWAPTALHGLAHPDGEIASAAAAGERGALFVQSTMSNRSIEKVAEGSQGPKWFQLYVHRDRSISEDMVKRAAAAGHGAIVLTADLPVPGYREMELRNPLQIQPSDLGNFLGLEFGEEDFLEAINGLINASLTWDDVAWLRGLSDLPMVLKGVLTAEDAALAVEHGVDAVWVSNHGGRQLDRSVAAVDALEEVVAAVDGRAEVYVDGGVRRGTDVVTALALGARAVFLGRPLLYALAAGGPSGVDRALFLLQAEVRNAMALIGARSVSEITRAHVV